MTGLCINQIIFQGSLESFFLGLRKMGRDIFPNGGLKALKKLI